ncbi:MAG: adenylate/guanylate cyclase domain-containing protein [Bacteroidota bacterium]
MDHQPIPEENIAIVQRFAKVFEQTYTRFLDLQKAEVQARKAQIDTSIERIRAKALAMHQSQEIQEVAKVIRGELRKLGIADVLSTGIWIEHQKGQIRAWDISTIPETESQDFLMEFTYPITDAKRHPKAHFWNIMYQGKDYFTTQSDKATLYATFNWLAESDENSAKELIGLVDAGYLTQWWHAVAAFEKGVIVVDFNEAPPPEMATILPRMAAAFDLAYRRFEDLERAEAQAREAQIEAALERVRARAMAMRHSKELSEAAELLYQEFFKLGVEPFSCGYLINDDEKGEWKVWLTNPGEPFFKENWTIPYNADHNLQARYESWKNQEAFHCTVLEGAANLAHHRVICQYAPWKEEMTETLAPQLAFNSAHFSLGHLLVISPNRLAAEMEQAMVRFAGVFDLTYRRFLDLQKAEAQNRQLEKTFQENQRLLHSILPEQIAEQIRQGQQTVVKRFEEVSILFADIVGFTVLSEKLLPSKVVAILNGLFSKFDDLTDKYGLEKIKTIGDAYMVASGVPEEKDNHALVLFQFAQELLQAINDYNQIVGTDLKIRIGISSGPVVAGVIGKKKFAYDLWGDSVNTAARMEAYGREDCIQISPTSYALLKEEFKFEKIPKVEIKGKGLMDVYVWRKTGKS